MHLQLLFLFVIFGFSSLFAYKIPDVKLEILSDGFRVSIPDEPGVRKVFFVMELNDMCPAFVDYNTAAANGIWATEKYNTKLKNNDKLRISIMVQHNENVFKISEYMKIENNNPVSTGKTDDNLTEKCNGVEADFTSPVITKPTTFGACTKSQSITRNGLARCQGDLMFEETFDDTTTLDLTRWSHDIRVRLNSHENEEFVVFTESERNSFVRDGALYIVPTIATGDIRRGELNLGDKCTSTLYPENECKATGSHEYKTILPPVYSAQIHTRGKFSFMFGRIEIKAKLPKGDWLFPYILLQPKETYVESYPATQIRIAFARGNALLLSDQNEELSGTRLYGGIVLLRGAGTNRVAQMRNMTRNEHFGDDYHVYSLTWKENSIEVAVDGVPYGEITDNMEFFRKEFYLILGVSVGGHLEFPDSCVSGTSSYKKPWDNTSPKAALAFWRARNDWKPTWNGGEAMKVDYVKVYAV